MAIKATALKVKTSVRAGRLSGNHVRAALKVRAGLKGGKISANHVRCLLAAG